MGIGFLGEVAKLAVITMFLAAEGCIVAAGFAVPMSKQPFQPAEAAFQLARAMAILGGVAAVVAGITATLFFWLTGQATQLDMLTIEPVVICSGVGFLGAVRLIDRRARSRA